MTLSLLEFDLHPGQSLGSFVLGCSLWSIIESLRQQQTTFPQISISYDNANPLSSPIVVHLRPYIDLLFSATQQRLHTISLRRLRSEPPLTIWYKSSKLISADQSLRRIDVGKVFGPTYPGVTMRYPGVWFGFEEDGQMGGKRIGTDDRTQEVRRIVVTQTSEGTDNTVDLLDEISVCEAIDGELLRATVQLHTGMTLHFHNISTFKPPLALKLGVSTAQDVILGLGPPLRVYHKEDERMHIHAPQSETDVASGSYFYNYFQHGMDLLFSATTHRLQRIVVHTNIPGSPNFQRYSRCPWEFAISGQGTSEVRFNTKLEGIIATLATSPLSSPMQLDRSENENLLLPSATTSLVALDGVVLEATELGDIASFTLF